MGTTSKKTVKTATAPARRTRRASAQDTTVVSVSSHEIAQKAYQYFEESGFAHGNDLDHWLRAERDLTARR